MQHISTGHVTHCGWPPDTPSAHRRDTGYLSHTVELEDGQVFQCAGAAEPGTEVRFTVDYGPFDATLPTEPLTGSDIDEWIGMASSTAATFTVRDVQTVMDRNVMGRVPSKAPIQFRINDLVAAGKLHPAGNGRWRAV